MKLSRRMEGIASCGRGALRRILATGMATAVLLILAAVPAAAQAEDDPATAELDGEYLSTTTVTKVRYTGDFVRDDSAFPGQTSTGRLTFTPGGKVVNDAGGVSYVRRGRTITYSRTYPDNVQCTDNATGEVLGSGPAFGEFTARIVEASDGVVQRMTMKSVVRYPPPEGSICTGTKIEHRTAEWVRVPGSSAVGYNRTGTLSVAVAVDADPLEVAAGDQVAVPVTVTGIASTTEKPCNVDTPLERPLTLDSVTLAESGGKRLIGTKDKPLNAAGTTIDVGQPIPVTADEPDKCSHRMVATTTATITVPADTAPGRYPLIPEISGLPRLASADSGKLVLEVVAAAPPPEEESSEAADDAAAPAAPPASDDDVVGALGPVELAGDFGTRSGLVAVLLAGAAAMFSRFGGRRARATGVLAGLVALGGGVIELVAGGLLGEIDPGEHLASGALSAATGVMTLGGVFFVLPWMSRTKRDARKAGPLIPLLLAGYVFANRLVDGVSLQRAGLAAVIVLLIAGVAVIGGSRTHARNFGLIAGVGVMVVGYLAAVVRDGSGTPAATEVIIALVLGGAAVLAAAFAPRGKATPPSDAASAERVGLDPALAAPLGPDPQDQ